MPKRGAGALPALTTNRPAPGHGGRPRRAQPRRPVPRPHRKRPASPADNDRGRPARGLGHGRSRRSAPLPCQRRRHGGDSRPRPLRPRSPHAPRRAGPCSLRHPRGSRGGRRRSGLRREPPGAARPLRARSGCPRRQRCGQPRRVSGEELSESAAEPGRAGPRLPGRAGRQGGAGHPRPPSTPRPPPPLTSGWVPRRPCRCSRSPAGSDHARGDSPPSWMGGTRRPRRCGRHRGGTEGGGHSRAGRGAAGAAGEGFPARGGQAARAGAKREGKGRARRSRSHRAASARRCPAALVKGRGPPGAPGSPAKPLCPLGISGR